MNKGAFRQKKRRFGTLVLFSLLFAAASTGASAAVSDSAHPSRNVALPKSESQLSPQLEIWRQQSIPFGPRFYADAAPSTGTSSPTSLGSAASATLLKGVYVGPADPSGVKIFESTTGTQVTIASDYLPSTSGWAGMDGVGTSLDWLTGAWQSSGYTLSLGVPMIPTNAQNVPQGTLALGASGAYDQYFLSLAQSLVTAGDGGSYLRLGWEFDGDWYAWQALNPTSEENYVRYFQQIVTTMRSVSGADFQFVWNPDASAFTESGYSVSAAYPGNSFVNVIGLDAYDMSWVTLQTPENVWEKTLLPELTAADDFAASVGKPIAICEWGVLVGFSGHGLGDDPLYINNMIAWMKTPNHDVAYESYFDGDNRSGSGQNFELTGTLFPKSQTAFAADFN